MRMGARKRDFVWAVLRSKGPLSLLLLALLLGLCQLEIAGRSLGSLIAELAIAPADARRASARLPRSFDSGLRHSPGSLQLPAFAPSPQTPAFVAAARTPAFAATAAAPAPSVPLPVSRQPDTAPP